MRTIIYLLTLTFVAGCGMQDTPSNTSDAPQPTSSVRLNHGDFSPFKESLNNKINSHSFVPNPDGSEEIVESFYIDGTACRGEDCNYGSVRSSVDSNIWDDVRPRSITSPPQAWYSFEIFFPEGTPTYPVDNPNTVTLVEFKEENQCASFAFVKNNNGGNSNSEFNFFLSEYTGKKDARFVGAPGECLSYFETEIANISDMIGKWVRFEYFVKWSENEDGYLIVYQDGRKVLERSGRTCSSTKQCLTRNIHYYGLYQPNNEDMNKIDSLTAYYRNVSMSQKREDLVR